MAMTCRRADVNPIDLAIADVSRIDLTIAVVNRVDTAIAGKSRRLGSLAQTTERGAGIQRGALS